MCGIVGIFNSRTAKEQIISALALLKNRGKDAQNSFKVDSSSYLGHTLHAIVGNLPQPIKNKGILVANCEIYNWQELAKKYYPPSKNDAELLSYFLDYHQLNKKSLQELDGVYAFAYLREGTLVLARDLLGIKPLWFSIKEDSFAFASERKVLEKIGFTSIEELNPRKILSYNLKEKMISFQERDFFSARPEHLDSYPQIRSTTEKLLDQAIRKRIPDKKFGLLFSGGIDSTYLAKYFKDNGHDFTCYTAVLDYEPGKEASDLLAAQKVAQELGLKLKIRRINLEQIPKYLKKIVPLIEDSNVVKVGVALTFYLACEMAKDDNCKVIFSGLGSEEIFAGYERHKNSSDINQECISGLLKMYERDLYRDDVLTMDNNLELRLPFLDQKLVSYALKIPARYKIKVDKIKGDDLHGETTKFILRDIAQSKGLPTEFSQRKKTAAQYGSKLDFALEKLAKINKSPSKSAYLDRFLPHLNLKLGVLFSSGKDSTSAALIMKQQNYELACLITMDSENPDSYMFQSSGIGLVKLQAKAMDLPLIVQNTEGKKEEELVDLEKAMKKAKDLYAVEGIITGALFSNYQRERIEKICDKLGLKIFSPLWHKPQLQHLQELIANKIEAVIVSVSADGLDQSWLGRKIDRQAIAELAALEKKNHLNVAGEGGEFETVVVDCPLFKNSIRLIQTEKVMDSSCSGKLIIKKAELIKK
jgi:asparagine synthase (glutamine-hydrolysing)